MEKNQEAYPLGYVEEFFETRTKLGGFFSIQLPQVQEFDIERERRIRGNHPTRPAGAISELRWNR